ncbi:hypothetical protein JTB14_036000 [Gonioctena quinquepunctata]|nr:hypothetical protein JTB14_036000 [Gonioctena quinquepunctata]
MAGYEDYSPYENTTWHIIPPDYIHFEEEYRYPLLDSMKMTGTTIVNQRQPAGFAISDILELDRQNSDEIDPISSDTSMYSPHQDLPYPPRPHWIQLPEPGLPPPPHQLNIPSHPAQLSPDSTSPAISERSSVDPNNLPENSLNPNSHTPVPNLAKP